jgi:hypothetical protein
MRFAHRAQVAMLIFFISAAVVGFLHLEQNDDIWSFRPGRSNKLE